MNKTEIKLGSTLVFDTEKEADLIKLVRTASSQHKLGEILSHLLRIYSENPDKLNESKSSLTKLIINMSNKGMTPERYSYFKKVDRELSEMRGKVDSIYDMCFEMYSLAQFGKRTGLEGKATNGLMAEFMLEKQLDELTEKLGVDNINNTFTSNRVGDTKKKSKEVLEYIINSYDNIVDELRQAVVTEVAISNVAIKEVDNNVQVKETAEVENKPSSKLIEVADDIDGVAVDNGDNSIDNEIIDFGKADLGALSNFFGE